MKTVLYHQYSHKLIFRFQQIMSG